ncbi:unnamed protein product, partial [Meganyctiphanes norvegica]
MAKLAPYRQTRSNLRKGKHMSDIGKTHSSKICMMKFGVKLGFGELFFIVLKCYREHPKFEYTSFGFSGLTGIQYAVQLQYKWIRLDFHVMEEGVQQTWQARGNWNKLCYTGCPRNMYCTDPPVIANARHDGPESQTRFEVNHTLKYSCHQGYTTKGFEVSKCFLYNNTMQWFGPEITCIPKSCGDPGEITNGFKQGNCFLFSCRITFNCRPGYELVGRDTHYCQHDATWSPREKPSCTPVQCSIPENPTNGKAIFIAVSYNAVVSYECNYGYMIVGSSTRRCGPNKEWSGEKPECKEINCGHPGQLSNGWLENIEHGTALGASIIFRCHPNMTIEGDQSTVCQADGSWSKPLPKCFAPCIVPDIDQGTIGNTSAVRPRQKVDHGTVIEIVCDVNYELSHGQYNITCNNGTWNHYPRCAPARCKKLPDRPRHGMVISPKTDHGAKAKYRCKDGYQLRGSSTTTCHYGNWTGAVPQCQEIYCPFPGYVENGRVLLVGNMGRYDYRNYVKKVRNNRQITYECNKGFYLIAGPPGATCVAGRWSPQPLPRCVPDLHPRIRWVRSIPENYTSEILNSSIKIKETITDKDFPTLLKHKEKVEDEIINENERKIYILTSSSPISVEKQTVTPVHTTENSQKSLNDLYRLLRFGNEGPHTIEDDQRWPALVRSPRNIENSLKKNKKAEREHKRRNRWKKKGKRTPHCESVPHEPYIRIEVLKPGRDSNFTFSAGARIKVTCLHGYGLNIGNKTAKCAKGHWKPAKPECVTLPCSVPEAPHGQFTFNGAHVSERATISHGEVVNFSCEKGYNVLGTNTMRCWYGEWAVTGKNPECTPDPCVLPGIEHGKYNSGYKKGLTIMHGASVEYSCDEGWIVNIEGVKCNLGRLVPSSPTCVAPDQRGETASHFSTIYKKNPLGVSYNDGDLTPGGDITVIDLNSNMKKSCSPPNRIQGTIVFKNGIQVTDHDKKFPDGSEVTFTCIENSIGDKTSWKVKCEDGAWVGRPLSCDTNATEGDITDIGNKTCSFRNTEPNVVTFFGDQQITEEIVEFEAGTELVSRCVDIGKYAFNGSHYRRCVHGTWTGEKPVCFGLNQESDYALEKPPTILFRHARGPIAQSNDGKLVVYPGTTLCLECLFLRKFGTPNWNVTHPEVEICEEKEKVRQQKKAKQAFQVHHGNSSPAIGQKKYPEGWANEPGRNSQLEYRLTHYSTKVDDSGVYTCVTPMGHDHSVELDIRAVDCEPIKPSKSLLLTPNDQTQMSTKVMFSCESGSELIGTRDVACLPSGNWSAPIPFCEKIKCPSPTPPVNGMLKGPDVYHAGDMVQITCRNNFMMDGQPYIVCQQDGTWSGEMPKCNPACTYPGTIISGTMSSVKFFYSIGDFITYKCSDGLKLSGAREIKCLEDRKWSASVPSCLPGR